MRWAASVDKGEEEQELQEDEEAWVEVVIVEWVGGGGQNLFNRIRS